MTKRDFLVSMAAVTSMLVQGVAFGVELRGRIDEAEGSNWQSAYMDLCTPSAPGEPAQ